MVLDHRPFNRPAPTCSDVAIEELAPAEAADAGGVARHGAQRLVDCLRAAVIQNLSACRDGGQRAKDVVRDLISAGRVGLAELSGGAWMR